MSEGGVKMLQGTYSPIPSRLKGGGIEHTAPYNTTDTVTRKWTRNNYTHRGDVE